jgi:hypothetical protein
VWRQIRNLGAVYLQQAAAILPDRREIRVALEELAERIRGFQGETSLLETSSPDPHWEDNLVQRFNQARDAEYAEVVHNVERLEDEVRRESRKSQFNFAQLEDIEADWEKLQRWHQRISARNFFDAPGQSVAAEALERGRAALEGFTAQVYAHEGVQEDETDSQSGESEG